MAPDDQESTIGSLFFYHIKTCYAYILLEVLKCMYIVQRHFGISFWRYSIPAIFLLIFCCYLCCNILLSTHFHRTTGIPNVNSAESDILTYFVIRNKCKDSQLLMYNIGVSLRDRTWNANSQRGSSSTKVYE